VNTAWLLEAAIRTLIMGAITWTALKALRIDHIRTRRTAWLMALGGALLMPLLVAAHIGPRILPDVTRTEPARFSAESGLAAASAASAPAYQITTSAPESEIVAVTVASRPPLKQFIARVAAGIYVLVAAMLLLRLGVGLGIALRLKWRAQRIDMHAVPKADVRISAQLMNPVTVTSSILLPRSYLQWDAATLRIVLSHEFAHVRQKDFYVQLLAGLHSALFWFNPFSWWLQRQLADLGEALSDHAAAQQAESRASYAEILLNFATGRNPPLAAVAMARSSNLAPRIERLLNEQGFERSFTARPRLPIVAAAVVTLALLASTSVKRVDAAASDSIVTPPAPEAPQPPEIAPWPEAPAAPEAPAPSPSPAPKPAPKPARPIPPLIAAAPAVRMASIAHIGPMAPIAPIAPVPAVAPMPAASPDLAVAPMPPMPPMPLVPPVHTTSLHTVSLLSNPFAPQNPDGVSSPFPRESGDFETGTWIDINDHGVSYMKADKDEVFMIKSGDSRFGFNQDFKKRFGTESPHPEGDFIFYQHQGKPFLIQDPSIIAKAQELLAPLKDNGLRQAELGQMRANLAMHRKVLRDGAAGAKVTSAEFQSAVEDMSKQLEQLKSEKLALSDDQETMISLQRKLGTIQEKLGRLQGELAMQTTGLRMREDLDGRQAEFAAEHERMAESNASTIKKVQAELAPLIEQAIKDGRAKPVN
jgi:beta-lactamase regulating signal transducer with metallopeptidase domain